MVERDLIDKTTCYFGAILFCLVTSIIIDWVGEADENTFIMLVASLALIRTFKWKAVK